MKYLSIKAFDIPDAWIQIVEKIYNEEDVFRVEFGSEKSLTKKIALDLEIERPENRRLVHKDSPFTVEYIGEKHEGEGYMDIQGINRLHFIVYFRSRDAYGGFPANVTGLQLLKEYMANEVGVEPGKTIVFAKDIHLYERQFNW